MSRVAAVMLTTLSLFHSLSIAQPAGQRSPFGRALPSEGSPLPIVNVHDDQGNDFSTAELKGSYTVLVFGCLT